MMDHSAGPSSSISSPNPVDPLTPVSPGLDSPAGDVPMQPAPQRSRAPAWQVNPHQQEIQGIQRDAVAEEVQYLFQQFLEEFTVDDEDDTQSSNAGGNRQIVYYREQIQIMKAADLSTLHINWSHLEAYGNQELTACIKQGFYRFEPYLRKSVQNFVRNHEPDFVENEQNVGEPREFFVSFYNLPEVEKIRDLKTDKIGVICGFSGTVTRTTEVRPELLLATFTCLECRTVLRDVTQQFKYTEPNMCTNANCKNTMRWQLEVEQSKFVDWQRARIQEHSSDIPPGSMPRSMDVICRGEIVEKAKPGDKCVFNGSLIVVPDVGQMYRSAISVRGGGGGGGGDGVTGLKAMGARQLTYKMVFLASSVVPSSKALGHANIRGDEDDADIMTTFTEEDKHEILAMKDTPKLFHHLAQSIAPNIYGHEDIKRGILLMLFGGVVKETFDGCKLRGDINICVVGDPSTAKSQFLKFVTRVLPRTVYTSGKASTAAGLTAAVMKDPDTGEFGIEAGALMLADNGICCIDEFDKMDEVDQAAIHEAMEQQTITITKAGVQATLNARASILAAANPIWGRYDTSKSLRLNVDITAPIMSRFDLFFVVLDECDEVVDFNVARHIVNMHRNVEKPISSTFNIDQLQKYIRFARTIKPRITKESKKLLVRYYRQLRQQDAEERKAYRFTVRQLESLIRLSEALARVHCDEDISPRYVKEASRLLKQSIISVDSPEVDLDAQPTGAQETAKDADGDENMDSQTKKMTISFQEYQKVANKVVRKIRSEESDQDPGMLQKELENWILEDYHQAGEVHNEQDAIALMTKINYIIKRLIDVDHILLVHKDDPEEAERVLEVHPNYDPEFGTDTATLKEKDSWARYQSVQQQAKKMGVTKGKGSD